MNMKVAVTMSTPNFRFKQFTIWHDKCAMKVGTDGVLLGAWATPADSHGSSSSHFRILDIGTGSGLIARMLMQRFPEAEVEGIDIDEAAVEQARENGVNAFLSSLQDWQIVHCTSSLCPLRYDLIVSNPPYFQNSLKNPDLGRQTARHTDTLSYKELITHSVRLLAAGGALCLILPAETEEEISRLAASEGLTITRVTRVYSKVSKPARRVLLQFEKSAPHDLGSSESRPVEETLVLEDDHGGRSDEYRELTKDFYL